MSSADGPAGGRLTMEQVMELARAYARERAVLDGRAGELREIQRAAARRRLRGIRSAAAAASAARDALLEAVDANRELFERPRTLSADGIKFGLRKKPGRMLVPDEAGAIAKLRRQLGAEAEALVRVSEKLNRSALKDLDARTLAAAGVTVVDAVDEPLASAPADDLDRLVEALLDGMDGEEGD